MHNSFEEVPQPSAEPYKKKLPDDFTVRYGVGLDRQRAALNVVRVRNLQPICR